MLLIRRIGTLKTSRLQSASRWDSSARFMPSQAREALDQWPIVAGYRQPSGEETDRRRVERGIALSTRGSREEAQ